jgi:DNA-binding CsgD family transcriptional regulator
MVQAIADSYFDFLQTNQQYTPPDHLGDVLNQARATSTFLVAVNKALREFCFAYLTDSLLVAGLEATADFFLTMMQAYIQTNQGVLALETISKQERASTEAMLTPPELTMLNYLVQGMTNKQIAEEMGVSERTVSNYLRRTRKKLGTERKADTMAAAIKLLGL